LPSRQFRDSRGAYWDVWDVHPNDALAPRAGYDRRGFERGDRAGEEASSREPLIDPLLEDGWLCFQSGAERRRFAPIPPRWSELPDAVLRVMVDIASPVAVTPPISRPPTPESR
jgi:hypothetical protein